MAWIYAVVEIGVALYGAYQTSQTNKGNQQAYGDSRADYEARIAAAQKGLAQVEDQYNKVREQRPDISWEGYVDSLVKSIDDPKLRAAYDSAKQKDFGVLRTLAKTASEDNSANFRIALNSASNGKAAEIIDQRNDLTLNNDTKQRFARAMELRAPEIGAGTVKYDEKGQLIEGQRADKQVFSTAYEVQDAVNKERLNNLAQLERDRSSVAASQQEKARSFMPFYDATGLSVNAFADNRKELIDFQKMDEMQAFDLYKTFAAAASGIQPSQPGYQSSAASQALTGQAVTAAGSALASYYKANQTSGSGNGSGSGSSTSMSTGTSGSSGTTGGPTYM